MLNDLATGTGSPEGSLEDGVRGGEAEWRAVMADFESWDGTQVSFCKARGISRKSFQAWRRSFDGLCALVSTHLGENPASGRWYVFINRRETDS